jgi:hypothetical protein
MPLPVYPEERTSSDRLGMSGWCPVGDTAAYRRGVMVAIAKKPKTLLNINT